MVWAREWGSGAVGRALCRFTGVCTALPSHRGEPCKVERSAIHIHAGNLWISKILKSHECVRAYTPVCQSPKEPEHQSPQCRYKHLCLEPSRPVQEDVSQACTLKECAQNAMGEYILYREEERV